jgi:hypothetical protein
VPTAPIAGETFGLDANQHPALGGFSSALVPVGARMVPDAVNPEIGSLAVAVDGGTGPTAVAADSDSAMLTLVGAAPAVAVSAVTTPAQVTIRNHDGSNPNGNADYLYVGFRSDIDASDFAYVLEPGEFIGIAINDPSSIYVYSAGAITFPVAVLG